MLIEKSPTTPPFGVDSPYTEITVTAETKKDAEKVRRLVVSPQFNQLQKIMNRFNGLLFATANEDSPGRYSIYAVKAVVPENGVGDVTVSNGVRTILRSVFGLRD